MKRKMLICTMAMTVLLLSGCGRNNTTNDQNHSGSNTTNTATEAPQATTAADHNVSAGNSVNENTNTTNNGTVSHNDAQATKITEEEAKLIALNHAGLTHDQVTFIKSGTDHENGQLVYDVEFYTNDHQEYDYEIDLYSGEILNHDQDAEYYGTTDHADGERISEEKAKKIALDKVPGATEQDIREFKTDYDNSRLEYEGKIYYEQKEYEFEIDGHTGTILEWDEEPIYGEHAAK